MTNHRESARRTLSEPQRNLLITVLIGTIVGLALNALSAMVVIIALFMLFQLFFVGLRLTAAFAGGKYRYPTTREVTDDKLPMYTTLHPMYKEANMIPLVVEAMEAMNYPKDRLQCLLVLEERDQETVAAARAANLPSYFQIIVVPAIKPYGKPKACNYALQYARGDMVVIFDAEDRPEPNQLRKAVSVLRSGGKDVGCVQARLVFENQATTWVSRFLGNEYSLHFGMIMAGMSRLGLILPLGGTSNHFPMQVLQEVAFSRENMPDALGIPAWDPYNVTEDAEIGFAIANAGYRTIMFDSYTDEEAPLTVKAAFNQRTRWIKGFGQTSLVLLRHPVLNAQRVGWFKFLCFLMTVGGTFASLLMTPIFWSLTAAYFIAKPGFIIELFPLPLYYMGLVLMIAGNLLLLYVSLIAALQHETYSTVKYLTMTLAWWAVLSLAAYTSLLELIFPRWRPMWNKTAHGVQYVPMWRRIAVRVQA